MKKLKLTDWNKPDKNDVLHIPDELDKVFNRVGNQMQFVRYSGKNPIQATADIIHICQEFFKEMYEEKQTESNCKHSTICSLGFDCKKTYDQCDEFEINTKKP